MLMYAVLVKKKKRRKWVCDFVYLHKWFGIRSAIRVELSK